MLTPWRSGLYKEIRKLNLSGLILDLGGSRKSGYHELIGGSHNVTVVNTDEMTIDKTGGLDLKFDLEKPFPLADCSFDAVTAFNVLEHIFNYKGLLEESWRVLKPKGLMVIGVPFLIYVHPSPRDYWRYTEETLRNILQSAGYSEIKVIAIGSGPFIASAQLLNTVFKIPPVRAIVEFVANILDWLLSFVVQAKTLTKRFPLGYYVVARK